MGNCHSVGEQRSVRTQTLGAIPVFKPLTGQCTGMAPICIKRDLSHDGVWWGVGGGGGRFVKQNCFSRMSEKNQQLRCLIEQCRKPIKSNSLCYTLKSASLASHEINRLCNFWNLRMKLLKQI